MATSPQISLIQTDSLKYKRKGYGLIVASLFLIVFFFIIPQIFKKYFWTPISTFSDQNTVFFVLFNMTHEILFVTANLIMLIIYKLKHPFFERYRINRDRKWPWEEEPSKWAQTLKRSLKFLGIAHLILIPVFTYVDTVLGLKFRFELESFPTPWELIWQITFFMFCEDFMFYWAHRALHHKSLYPYIHKIHHEYNNPIGISSEFAHPIEYFLANMLPNAFGPKLLGTRVHLFTYFMWIVLRILETTDGHCGYEFSWSPYRLLPLSGSASYHNYHHTHNIGNFGSFFMIWDSLMGTNKSYFNYLKRKEEKAEKEK